MNSASRRDFLKSLGLGVGSLGLFGLKSREIYAEIRRKVDEVKSIPQESSIGRKRTP